MDKSAIFAGIVKNSFEELQKTAKDIARLTSINTPYEETRARDMLETLIDAKRSYVHEEDKRKRHGAGD